MNRSLTLKDKKQLVLNSDIKLTEQEGNGKGRYFVSRFIEPGIAHYEELGDILITKETLNKFIQTMIGVPVIIDHEDVTDKNVDKLRVGSVSKVWFDEFDGYFYCEGILTDPEAIDLVKNQGWNVSCAYSFVADETKKQHNGKDIDMEFTDGEFLHLAIVKNPRYEGANIVVNKNDDELEWITVKGNHIPIKKGQSKDDAVKEFLEGKQSDTKDKSGDGGEKDEEKKLKIGDNVYLTSEEGPNKRTGKITKQISDDVVEVEFEAKGKSPARTDRYYIDELSKDKSGDSGEKEAKTKDKTLKDVNSKDFDEFNKLDFHYEAKSKKDGSVSFISYENQYKNIKRTVLFDSDKTKVFMYSDPNSKELRIIAQPKNDEIKLNDVKEALLRSKPRFDKEIEKYNKINPKVRNNIGDITMTVLNDLTDFIKKVVKNEKEDEMKEVKNEDKRKLIDEVGGILKGKVDEELWRTVVGKLEKIAYEPSEDDKADNKAKNEEDEEEAKNKCKNEEDKKEDKKETENEDEEESKDVTENEEDEEKEEKTENKKVKNSIKDVVMGGSMEAQETKLYTSRKERLEEGNKY